RRSGGLPRRDTRGRRIAQDTSRRPPWSRIRQRRRDIRGNAEPARRSPPGLACRRCGRFSAASRHPAARPASDHRRRRPRTAVAGTLPHLLRRWLPARDARPDPPRQPLLDAHLDLGLSMTKPVKQIHLAAHFPGVNNTTVWSDPASGSHIDFSSFVHFAQTAERGKFDFMFLAEGLRLREQNGQIYDLDVVGRPDTFTILAALAAVTDHLGLTGTINSTFNEPYEVARQFASLDHLSGGRAAWNVVTSWDAFTGENFRRGGYLAQGDRYD